MRSFRAKIIGLVLGVAFICLLTASTGLGLVEFSNFKKRLSEAAVSNAAILSFNLVPSVLFDDADNARHLLASLATMPYVTSAGVYQLSDDGTLSLLAGYPDLAPMLSPHEVPDYLDPVLSGLDYRLTYPIQLEGDLVGYLHINARFDTLEQAQFEIIGVVVGMMIGGLLLAMVMALKFQAILLKPLMRMVQLTRQISHDRDYGLRMDESVSDEFGHLARSFNHMLGTIEQQLRLQQETEFEIRQLNQNLEDKVSLRTRALMEANDVLQTTLDKLNHSQRELVEREKMASLGGLVAGIAHEVNTPIGVGVTASSHLHEQLQRLENRFLDGSLTPEDLTRYIENAREGIDITSANLTRAADLVRSFKQVAVDQSSNNVRIIRVHDYLQEILLSLRPQLKRVQHVIDVQCDEWLNISCNAGALSQILTNLIMNSLIHGFEGVEQGGILIKVDKTPKGVRLTYRDNGVGMPPELLKRVFEPFFTTRRDQGGSGLGTHLVYNLVTQALNGSIAVSSSPGEGVCFEIEFPDASQS